MKLVYLLRQIKVKYDPQESPSLLKVKHSNMKQFPKQSHAVVSFFKMSLDILLLIGH